MRSCTLHCRAFLVSFHDHVSYSGEDGGPVRLMNEKPFTFQVMGQLDADAALSFFGSANQRLGIERL